MKLSLTNLHSTKVVLPQPVGVLNPREYKILDVHSNELEQLSESLVRLQRAGYIQFNAYNDMSLSTQELDTEFMTVSDIQIQASTPPENMALLDAVRKTHEPIISPSRAVSQPGQGPQPSANGTLMTLVFTLNQASNRAYRIMKIPTTYVGDAAMHVHWTKSDDAVETGNTVRWRVGYSVFNGNSDVANTVETVLTFDGVYADSGTTTRIVYRSIDVAASGFVAGWYVSLYIEAITPNGTQLSHNPALLSLDFTYNVTINEGD